MAKMSLRKEAAGLYRGGPRLRFTVRRTKRTSWLITDSTTGRRETVKRLKDARFFCLVVLTIEPKPTQKKGGQ